MILANWMVTKVTLIFNMRFENNNFFSHFNNDNKKPNYSHEELRYKLEVESRLKSQKITDKKLLKPTK